MIKNIKRFGYKLRIPPTIPTIKLSQNQSKNEKT